MAVAATPSRVITYILAVRVVAVLLLGLTVQKCLFQLVRGLSELSRAVHTGKLLDVSPTPGAFAAWVKSVAYASGEVLAAVCAILLFMNARRVGRALMRKDACCE